MLEVLITEVVKAACVDATALCDVSESKESILRCCVSVDASGSTAQLPVLAFRAAKKN